MDRLLQSAAGNYRELIECPVNNATMSKHIMDAEQLLHVNGVQMWTCAVSRANESNIN
jgi:hypothetical protein